MAKIPLRTYDREIEKLIDQGQTDEAIAHCQYILQSFPKHVDTYRLLGKAYLERQQYGEAADLFLRVLSVIPDDFVAQIGMSIIREDEANLDASIWHMERAYEVQPSNNAVQEELRRLYGRRDGVEPPRVRLTRGALVRMYARGDLYHQALAEIKVALSEDPNRLDLKSIQARMFYLAGQKAESTEICSSLLSKFPYCLEANRLLVLILPSTTRSDDAKIYQQRMTALDPYLAYLSPTSSHIEDIPDNAVLLNRLDYEPQYGTGSQPQPQWAESLGINLGTTQTTDQGLPDWMTVPPQSPFFPEALPEITPEVPVTNSPAAEEAIEPPVKTETPIEETVSEELPDFLKDIGWVPSSGLESENRTPTADEPAENLEDIAPAEIPDWLKSLAPAETAQPTESETPLDQDLARLLGGSLETHTTPVSVESDVTPPSISDIATTTTEKTTPSNEETPEWLQDLTAQPVEETQETTSDWLKDLANETESGEILSSKDSSLPDWIPLTPETVDENQPMAHVEDLPEWMKEPSSETPVEETPAQVESVFPEIRGQSAEENSNWLQGEEVKPSEISAQSTAELPDWLQGFTVPETSETGTSINPEASAIKTPILSNEDAPLSSATISDTDAGLAWLEGLAAKHGADEETLYVPPEQRTDIPPEWAGITIESVTPEAVAEIVPEVEQPVEASPDVEDLPDWLQEISQPDEIPPETKPDISQAATNVPVSRSLDDTTGLAWLEGLAAKHGADEDTLYVPPEQRTDTPPEWVSASIETPPPIEETETPSIAAEQTASLIPDDGMPDWLHEISQPDETTPSLESKISSDSVPSTEPIDETDGLAWLEGLAAKQGASEDTLYIPPEQRTKTPPAWASGTIEEKTVEPTVPTFEAPTDSAEIQPDEEKSEEELPEWLSDFSPSITTKSSTTSEPAPEWHTPDETKPPLEPTPIEAKLAEEIQTGEEITPPISEGVTLDKVPAVEVASPPESPAPIQILDQPDAVADTQPVKVLPTPSIEISSVTPGIPAELNTEPEPVLDPSNNLIQAHEFLDKGNIAPALEIYNACIRQNIQLDSVIQNLRDALYRYPVDISIWQTLGDAYVRVNRIQDALDAYTKAEELLR